MTRWEVLAVFVGAPAAISAIIIALVLIFTPDAKERVFPILRPSDTPGPVNHRSLPGSGAAEASDAVGMAGAEPRSSSPSQRPDPAADSA